MPHDGWHPHDYGRGHPHHHWPHHCWHGSPTRPLVLAAATFLPFGGASAQSADAQPRIADRAIRLAQTGEIVAADGTVIQTDAKSLCIHGDNPEAVAIARQVRTALEAAGIAIRAAF